MPQRPIRLWYALFAMVASFLLGLGLTFGYVNQVDRQSDRDNEANDRKWCALLVLWDDTYKASPPPSELGRQFAVMVHTLRTDLGC